MTEKYLALRVQQYDKIEAFLKEQGVDIVHSRLETRDQALSNLTEGLFDQGMERMIDQHELRWMQVKGAMDDDIIKSWSLCDLALDVEWFDQYKHDIRHCSGVAYWDATYGLAKQLTWKPQERKLSYQVHKTAVEAKNNSQNKELEQELELDFEQAPEQSAEQLEQPAKLTQIKKTKASGKKKVAKEFQLDLFG